MLYSYHVHGVYQSKPTVHTEFGIFQVFYFISNILQPRWAVIKDFDLKQAEVPKVYKCDYVKLV
jgi:hypothetical protein